MSILGVTKTMPKTLAKPSVAARVSLALALGGAIALVSACGASGDGPQNGGVGNGSGASTGSGATGSGAGTGTGATSSGGSVVLPLVRGDMAFANGAVIPVDGGLSIARL